MKTNRAARSTTRPAARRPRLAALLEAIETRRLMSAATLDPTFGDGGTVRLPFDAATPVAFSLSTVDSAGRVLNASLLDGQTDGFYVTRYTTEGLPDGTFNGDGTVLISTPVRTLADIAVDASGAVFVGVLHEDADGATVMSVERVGADGFDIGNFGGDDGAVAGVTTRSTGDDFDLVVDGDDVYGVYSEQSDFDASALVSIAKFDATTGTDQSDFGTAGRARLAIPGAVSQITDAVISNGGLAVVGSTLLAGASQVNNALVGRIAADGSAAAWSTAGVEDSFRASNAVALPGGQVVIQGTVDPVGDAFLSSVALVGFNADGSTNAAYADAQPALDALNFSTLGEHSAAFVADAQGHLYLAGVSYDAANEAFDAAVVRLGADGRPDATFDDDGLYVRADAAVMDYAFSAALDADGGLFVTAVADGEAKVFKFPGESVTEEPPAPLPFSVVNNVLTFVAPAPGAGQTGNDAIAITKNADGTLSFTLNGTTYAVPAGITGISIDAGVGNDLVKISTALTIPATIVGGAGNDTLRGGSGNDVLLGGEGDDAVIGRDGQDFLLGGNGRDYLVGREDADILITGNTTLGQAGIDAVMREWTSNHSYIVKLANISGLLPLGNRLNGNNYLTPGITIFNDTSVDTLSGGDGADFEYWQLFGQNADVYRANLTSFRSDVAALITSND